MNDNYEAEIEQKENKIEENDKYNNTISIIIRLVAKLFLIIGIIVIILHCFNNRAFNFQDVCFYLCIYSVISLSLFAFAEIITLLQEIKDELKELKNDWRN